MNKTILHASAISIIMATAVFWSLPQPAHAFTNPTWGTPEVPLIMHPVSLKGVRIDAPGSSVNNMLACGSRWIFTSAFQVFAADGTTVTPLTSYANPYGKSDRTFPTIACGNNGMAYWTYQDGGTHVQSYNGIAVTDVSIGLPTNVYTVAEQTVNDHIVFVPLNSPNLFVYDGSSLTTITKVQTEDELGSGSGSYTLVLGNGYLYKVVGDKAFDISAQTGIKWIRVVKHIGGVWYIGGSPAPDEYEAEWPNSLVSYDGSTFTNLSKPIQGKIVGDISGESGNMIVNAGVMYRFDGQQFKKLTVMKFGDAAPAAGATDWNGQYWLTGNALSLKDDIYGLFRFSSDQDPMATSIYTSKGLGISFQYLSTWDKPYGGGKPPLYNFLLPAYKGVTYNLEFQRGTDGLYNNAIMNKAKGKDWNTYTNSFVTWYKKFFRDYDEGFGTSKMVSWTTSSFPVKGLNATKVVFVVQGTSNMDPKHPNQKGINREEFILIGSKDGKKRYILHLSQSQMNTWTLSKSFYAPGFENMAKSFRIL